MSDYDFVARIQRLVTGLIERSRPKSVGDEPSDKWDIVDGDTYELSLSRSTLRVRSRDGDGTYPFVLDILDDSGRIIESVIEGVREDEPYYGLAELFTSASRNNLGVESKLDEIFSELNISDTPPPKDDPWGKAPF
ncbi:hypothetical protein LB823_20680 [Tsukamurella sp. M9C]|uniref:hypothetical protein n=1 Tax=Tsukamurella sp. M9C TaxID=2877520 RepID=UPI001CCD362D|nr:hypothetical protein [Tsukamurella sp. M9C]MCA0158620.1 hypothetical protein [Tsukamurella sp. M9C]